MNPENRQNLNVMLKERIGEDDTNFQLQAMNDYLPKGQESKKHTNLRFIQKKDKPRGNSLKEK